MRRFSIAGLMIVVLVCGVAVAALRNASDTWAAVMFTLTLGLLGTAVLGALYHRGSRRAFFAGASLFGWGYLLLTFGPWFTDQIEPRLATTQALSALHARLEPPVTNSIKTVVGSPATAMMQAYGALTNVTGQVQNATLLTEDVSSQPGGGSVVTLKVLLGTGGKREQFIDVGQCLFSLLIALLGGLIARRFHRAAVEAE